MDNCRAVPAIGTDCVLGTFSLCYSWRKLPVASGKRCPQPCGRIPVADTRTTSADSCSTANLVPKFIWNVGEGRERFSTDSVIDLVRIVGQTSSHLMQCLAECGPPLSLS